MFRTPDFSRRDSRRKVLLGRLCALRPSRPAAMACSTLIVATIAAPTGELRAQGGAPLYGVKTQQVWITMQDGVRLATTLYMPEGGAAGDRFPAVFKYDPYRKDEKRGPLSECALNDYFARHGYVGACVDIRGSGSSEGQLPEREYSAQELSDGEEIIAWLASQPWSSGAVGVFGKSWSGFNAMQLAMRNPPALKAIITVDSTDRLYEEDVHYTHGILNVGDRYDFGGIDALTPMSRPPDFPLDESSLRGRFDRPPWSLLWMQHQREDSFWLEPEKPLSAIHVPVLLIGAFFDGYRDTIPRWLATLQTPARAIIGPWGHDYPHDVHPGPAIEWRDLAVRWWDQWLKGKDTRVMSDPKVAVYMRHWYPPDPAIAEIPGDWRSANSWPPAEQKISPFYLRPDHSLSHDGVPEKTLHSLRYVASIGVDVGLEDFDSQPDQRPVDAFSLVYDSKPLDTASAILGIPTLVLRASATAPLADWFARLSDVAPDGSVTLITSGALNGAQRDSMAHPQDLEPGKVYKLLVPMHFTSWVFPVGHRIRVSVSNAQWPMFWPTPYKMTTSLYLGGPEPSRLLLPTVPLVAPLPPPHFNPLPESDRPAVPEPRHGPSWTLQRGQFGTTTVIDGTGEWSKPNQLPWGLYSLRMRREFQVRDDHPELASYTGERDVRVQTSERELIWHFDWNLHSDQRNFYYRVKRSLLENGKTMREREWQETVARDHQ